MQAMVKFLAQFLQGGIYGRMAECAQNEPGALFVFQDGGAIYLLLQEFHVRHGARLLQDNYSLQQFLGIFWRESNPKCLN
jgi:hypothetical protein